MLRKRKTRAIPVISTASLTDIIFILLFFFMVTSTIRLNTTHVKVQLPNAQSVDKRKDDPSVCYLYIGEPQGKVSLAQYSVDGMAVQLNDEMVTVNQIAANLKSERAKLPKYQQDKFTVSLKIHKDAKMKLVKAVKEQLKQAGALRVDYAGSKAASAL